VTSRNRLLAAALLIPLLAGCDLGHPGGFTAGSNSYCGQTSTAIEKLKHPDGPKAQLQYATDRYALIERLVSEMTEASLPGATKGARIRTDWLQPARTSLVRGRDVLAELRDAANAHDTAAADTAFSQSLAVGTVGVDTQLLRDDGLGKCAIVFAPTSL
jgi:hypothetical protein